jgi:hypothetical protein
MRPDQLQQLQDLSERLADVFLSEADPDNWSGAGKLPADMTKDERGDRHWDRKGAMGTGGVLRYTMDLIASRENSDTADDELQRARDADLEAKIDDAKKRAHAAMKRVLDKTAKANFDAAIHGRKG